MCGCLLGQHMYNNHVITMDKVITSKKCMASCGHGQLIKMTYFSQKFNIPQESFLHCL